MILGQSWLLFLLIALWATKSYTAEFSTNDILLDNKKSFEKSSVENLFKPDPNIPMAQDPRFNKMLPLQKIGAAVPTIKSSTVSQKTELSPQTTNSIEPSSTAETESKPSTEADDYYYDEYNDLYYDENNDDADENNDETNNNKIKKSKSTEKQVTIPILPLDDKTQNVKLNPIKANDNNTYEDEISTTSSSSTTTNESIDDGSDIDEDADDADEDDDVDDDDDDESYEDYDSTQTDDIPISETNIPCPRDCICEKKLNTGFMVATCNRLDPTIQKFGSDITDLQVLNVPSKFKINLGPRFFEKIGLKQISSIKIVNATIETIHPSAFENLNELYLVNLTNAGLNMIHPDTFSNNRKLRILTLSGNDLNAMQQKASPFADYMLKAPSVEELDISRCNLKQMLNTAFNKLENIVFINLADNELKTLPIGLFDNVETIEELDISTNFIAELPKNIFNKTSLGILNLMYNKIQNNLEFITSDLQRLDISYNRLNAINNGMFRKATGLTSLKLKGNSIRRILPVAFRELRNLRYLDLSSNLLEELSSEIFLTTRDLQVVKLNDNAHLKRLPLEGFETEYDRLNIQSIDISNCDISELGDNTFSTMSLLTTLNLSWNNINSLGKGIFSYLNRLVTLDISNNILEEIDDLLFLHNRKLKKLSIGGNQLRKLSAKVFLPTKELTDLDMSDCNLKTMWAESSLKISAKNTFKKLKSLNVSHNEIEHIYKGDLELMTNILVLDITHNPLNCDEDFKNLMKWLGKKKIKAGNAQKNYGRNAELHGISDEVFVEDLGEHSWDALARTICKRELTLNINKQKDDDTSIISNVEDSYSYEDDDDAYEEDNKSSSGTSSSSSISSSSSSSISSDNSSDRSSKSDDKSQGIIDNVESDSYEDDYDEEVNDKTKKVITLNKSKNIQDLGLFAEEIDSIKSIGDKIIDFDDDDDEIILERRSHTYYGQYRFLMPILIVVFSTLAVLIIISKIIALIMKRRGERYRQALLASKNSIVYQKLSEEIAPPSTPKLHKYSPINQV